MLGKKLKHLNLARWWLIGLCVWAGGSGSALAQEQEPPQDRFYANSLTAAEVLQRWYNTNGLWDSTGWWNAANCLEAIESVVELTDGTQFRDVIRHTFDRNLRRNFLNEFYDDEGWWALAWIRAFDLTGEARYMEMARTIFADMKTGWDDHCGGGIWWKKERHYKNAIANELFLLVAIRLHQRTPGDQGAGSYLDWAEREWAWFKQTGMINAKHLVNDGLTLRCENNHRTTWSYNQGVLIGGLVELYKTTGVTNHLAEAVAIADATLATLVDEAGILCEPNEARGLHGADVPQFKGIFIRHLAELLDVTGSPAYRDFLVRNARAVWLRNRDSAGRLGGRWSGPVDAVDAARHSSAMRVITALGETPIAGTNNPAQGRYYRSAAALEHELGRRIGENQWAASPLHDKDSGLLAKSSPMSGLPSGKYEMAVELKVDNFNLDDAVVAKIVVANLDSQRTVMERELKRSDFPSVLYRRFAVRFEARQGQRYEVLVLWSRTPAAPQLTQRSLSITPVPAGS